MGKIETDVFRETRRFLRASLAVLTTLSISLLVFLLEVSLSGEADMVSKEKVNELIVKAVMLQNARWWSVRSEVQDDASTQETRYATT